MLAIAVLIEILELGDRFILGIVGIVKISEIADGTIDEGLLDQSQDGTP